MSPHDALKQRTIIGSALSEASVFHASCIMYEGLKFMIITLQCEMIYLSHDFLGKSLQFKHLYCDCDGIAQPLVGHAINMALGILSRGIFAIMNCIYLILHVFGGLLKLLKQY